MVDLRQEALSPPPTAEGEVRGGGCCSDELGLRTNLRNFENISGPLFGFFTSLTSWSAATLELSLFGGTSEADDTVGVANNVVGGANVTAGRREGGGGAARLGMTVMERFFCPGEGVPLEALPAAVPTPPSISSVILLVDATARQEVLPEGSVLSLEPVRLFVLEDEGGGCEVTVTGVTL